MAAMTTAITEFSDRENVRTWTYTGHAIQTPRLIIQKRRVPTSATGKYENTFSVVAGTVDGSSVPLSTRLAFDLNVRGPADGASADVSATLAVFRDLVNSDEFAAAVATQNYLK
jgi:hypothetical protein